MHQHHRLRRIVHSYCVSSVILSLSLMTSSAKAGFDEAVENALTLGGGKYGKVNLDLRWRYEYVDQNSAPGTGKSTPDPANASTLRARVGYLTPEFFGFKAFAEFEGLQDVGASDYNDNPAGTGNGKTNFPVVADPAESELNQAWVSYSGLPDTTLKVGRQRIAFDNHRFIGDVIWRQLQQTYDAVTLTSTLIPRTTATAGYIFKVQDIFSRTEKMASPILNVSFDTGYGKLIGYGYWLDYQDRNDSKGFANSTKTYGIRFDGSTPIVDNLKALYTLEYAHQQDYEDNPARFNVDYWLTEAGLDIYGVTLKGAMEELGSDKGIGFSTPLSTLHAFQGWADLFLNTPKEGIRDLYGTVKTSVYGVDLMAVYHEFSDDTGALDYGHEIDLIVEKKFGKHYSVLLKFADFSNAPYSRDVLKLPDTQKFWIQGGIAF